MGKNVLERPVAKWERGQALLVIVLVMVVALTAGLSVAIRTTTNIRTADDEKNSQKAFSAAEAGLEQSLVANPTPIAGKVLDGARIDTQITNSTTSSFLLNNGVTILKDDPVDVWLSDYGTYNTPWSGNLTILWGVLSDVCDPTESNNSQAALEVLVLSGPKANPQLTTYTFDPCASRRSGTGNNFSAPSSASTPADDIAGNSFAYKVSLPFINSGLFIRIIPLYASAKVGVKGDSILPVQGKIISSTGTLGSIKRKIVSFRGNPKLPFELFPFIIFSPK